MFSMPGRKHPVWPDRKRPSNDLNKLTSFKTPRALELLAKSSDSTLVSVKLHEDSPKNLPLASGETAKAGVQIEIRTK